MQKEAKYFDSPSMRESLKRYMRTQMTLKNIKYRDLSERLAEMGVIQGLGQPMRQIRIAVATQVIRPRCRQGEDRHYRREGEGYAEIPGKARHVVT